MRGVDGARTRGPMLVVHRRSGAGWLWRNGRLRADAAQQRYDFRVRVCLRYAQPIAGVTRSTLVASPGRGAEAIEKVLEESSKT